MQQQSSWLSRHSRQVGTFRVKNRPPVSAWGTIFDQTSPTLAVSSVIDSRLF